MSTERPLAGFAAERCSTIDTHVRVEMCGFHTFDEGLAFYKMLEAFDPFLQNCRVRASSVESVLVVSTQGKSYVYLNNSLPIIGRMRVKRACGKGEAISRDDVADIAQLEFPGIIPPDKAGFLFLISAGWRRGICFDFRALTPNTQVSSRDSFEFVKRLGGIVLAHLLFTEKFLLTPDDWAKVISVGWFPFICLPINLWESLFDAIKNEENTEEQEDQIHHFLLGVLTDRFISWSKNKHIQTHVSFLSDAVDAYKNGKWAICISSALPRIEGMLRQAFGAMTGKNAAVMEAMQEKLSQREHSRSLLFPEKLRDYFETVLYPYTTFNDSDLPATRHTHAHGLVEYERLGRKQALTLLLLIDHIMYCLPMSGLRDSEARPFESTR